MALPQYQIDLLVLQARNAGDTLSTKDEIVEKHLRSQEQVLNVLDSLSAPTDRKSAITKTNLPVKNVNLANQEGGAFSRPTHQLTPEPDDAVTDFFGNMAWSFIDTATFGGGGLLFEKIAPKAYKDMMTNLQDTTAGRIGGGIGGAAGFLMPMGWVGRGTKLATRGLAKAGVFGKAVKKGTTSGLQKQAARKLMKESAKNFGTAGRMSEKQALNIIKSSTDDLAGFKTKGFGKWAMGGGPAHGLEHGLEQVAAVKKLMKSQLPGRLATSLRTHGVEAKALERMGTPLRKMSDEMVELMGRKPLQTIESIVASKIGNKYLAPVMKVAAAMQQEGLNMLITGGLMDWTESLKDQPRLEGTWGDRLLQHYSLGTAFGFISHWPGGRSTALWRDFRRLTGGRTRKTMKAIKNMSPEQVKAMAWTTSNTTKTFAPRGADGILFTERQLLTKGLMEDPANIKALKESLVAWERQAYGDLIWRAGKSPLGAEIVKDIITSSPRMIAGAVAMNHHVFFGEDKIGFQNAIQDPEMGFHLFLSMAMTKRGRSLFEGRSVKKAGMQFGEKPLYFDSKLRDTVHGMKERGLYVGHIEQQMKSFGGETYAMMTQRGQNSDFKTIIDILESNGVIVKSTGEPIRVNKNADGMNADLAELVHPIMTAVKLRGYEINPNAKFKNQTDAANEIRSTASAHLSTPDNTINLNSSRVINNSKWKSTVEWYASIGSDALSAYDAMLQQLTSNASVTVKGKGGTGEAPQISVRSQPKFEGSSEVNAILVKFEHLREKLLETGLLIERPIEINGAAGIPIGVNEQTGKPWSPKEWTEKMGLIKKFQDNFDTSLGSEYWGSASQMKGDHLDKGLWLLMQESFYQRMTANTYDIIAGNNTGTTTENKYNDIQGRIHKLFASNPEQEGYGKIVDNANSVIEKLSGEDMQIAKETYIMDTGRTEYDHMIDFVHAIHSIAATNKSATGGKKRGEVPYADVKTLYDKLTDNEVGMPDFSKMGSDQAFKNWIYNTRMHGIQEVLAGSGANYSQSVVISRMMESGIFHVNSNRDGTSSRIMGPASITVDQVISARPSLTPKEAEMYVESYKKIINELGNAVDTTSPDIFLNLSDNSLAALYVAEKSMAPEKIQEGYNKLDADLIRVVDSMEETRKILNTEMKVEGVSNDMVADITARMQFNAQGQQEISRFQTAFLSTVTAHGFDRSAAYLHWINSTGLMKDVHSISKAKTQDEFESITSQISRKQAEIANLVHNAARLETTPLDIHSMDNLPAVRGRELEGRSVTHEKNSLTPDQFFSKYNMTQNSFKASSLSNWLEGTTRLIAGADTNTKIIATVYDNTIKKYSLTDPQKGIDMFIDTMVRAAGSTTDAAPNSLRSDVLRMFNLNERLYQTQTLTLDLRQSGSGTFKETQISKGPLTDLYSTLFPANKLLILDTGYITRNGQKSRLGQSGMGALGEFVTELSRQGFIAQDGTKLSKEIAEMAPGIITGLKNQDLVKESILGDHYILPVDENIKILMHSNQFNELAGKFTTWHKEFSESNYTKSVKKTNKRAAIYLEELATLAKDLDNIRIKSPQDGIEYKTKDFKGASNTQDAEFLSAQLYKMFDAMYSQSVDGDFLNRMFTDPHKWIKTKRLHQNQGYVRQSAARDAITLSLYGSDPKYGKMVRKYANQTEDKIFVIDDSVVSKAGEDPVGFITDARSVAEQSLQRMKDAGTLSDVVFKSMQAELKESPNLNGAESQNAMTLVRREYLDYLLLSSSQEALIGNSAGMKPVGLSSYTDANGMIHVWTNKTHYFYSKEAEGFFSNPKNSHIEQIAFKSGGKKANKIQTGKGQNNQETFKGYNQIPKITDINKKTGKPWTMAEWLTTIKAPEESVITAKRDQMVNGTVYETHGEVKIMKQAGNWMSEEFNNMQWEWGRQDAAHRFLQTAKKHYTLENMDDSIRELKTFVMNAKNLEGTYNLDAENVSDMMVMLANNAPPHGVFLKDFSASLLFKRYAIESGVMDGWTEAGTTSVLRGNIDSDLNIPIFASIEGKRTQIILGEVGSGWDVLQRKIRHGGEYGTITVQPGREMKKKARSTSSQTISYFLNDGKGERDLLLDPKNGRWWDPRNPNKGKPSPIETAPKEIQAAMKSIQDAMNAGEITTYNDLRNFLHQSGWGDQKLDLVQVNQRGPKTGPHDGIVAKSRKVLAQEDGAVGEVNVADVTRRLMGDHDTDHTADIFDMPFEMVVETAYKSGTVKEAGALTEQMKTKQAFDPSDWASVMEYYGKKEGFAMKRGQVLGMSRKLELMNLVFKRLGDEGLEIVDGRKITFKDGMEDYISKEITDITSANQHVLDIDAGFANRMENMTDWAHNVLFYGENPFFSVNGGKFNKARDNIEQLAIQKIIQDYSKIVKLESKLYESGEAKSPRYDDLVSSWGNWKESYDPKNINYTMYNYYKRVLGADQADKLFYGDKGRLNSAGRVNAINPIFDGVANALKENLTTVEKSLNSIASRDHLEPLELRSSQGKDYNSQVNRMIARYRGEALAYFQITGKEVPEGWNQASFEGVLDQQWGAIRDVQKNEKLLAAIEVTENKIRRQEFVLANAEKNGSLSKEQLLVMGEDIQIQRLYMDSMLNRMTLDAEFNTKLPLRQTYITKGKDDRNVKVPEGGRSIAVYRGKSGKKVRMIRAGEDHWLKDGEVAVKNPVEILPVDSYEYIDAVAISQTVGSYTKDIMESDMGSFDSIVREAQLEIRTKVRDFMMAKEVRNWEGHQGEIGQIVDKHLSEVINLANGKYKGRGSAESSIEGREMKQTHLWGILPEGKQDYGKIFLLSLLTQSESQPGKFHYVRKTGTLVPALRTPSKAVIRAAFAKMKEYGVHGDHKEFLSRFSKDYKAWTDVLMAGDNFQASLNFLQNGSFEGSLVGANIDKAMNSPFLPREEFSTLREYMDMTQGVESNFAELFRQIIQDRALIDPLTALNLKQAFISEHGTDQYHLLFEMARKDLVGDGISTTSVTPGGGQGVLMGHMKTENPLISWGRPQGARIVQKGAKLKDSVRDVIGEGTMEVNERGDGKKCPQ